MDFAKFVSEFILFCCTRLGIYVVFCARELTKNITVSLPKIGNIVKLPTVDFNTSTSSRLCFGKKNLPTVEQHRLQERHEQVVQAI